MTPQVTARRVGRAALVLTAALCLACGKEAPMSPLVSVAPADSELLCDVPFAVVPGLERVSSGSWRTPGIVDNPDDFCRLWNEVVPPYGSSCDPKAVDFDREVVLVAGGTCYGTTGFAVEVACVQTGSGPGLLEVFHELHAPGDHCVTGQMMTCPVAIVKVPRPAHSATFELLRTVRHDCN